MVFALLTKTQCQRFSCRTYSTKTAINLTLILIQITRSFNTKEKMTLSILLPIGFVQMPLKNETMHLVANIDLSENQNNVEVRQLTLHK